MERAFQETYGIPMSDVMKHEDLAIGSYRRSVSSIIPEITKIAFVEYKDQIQQAQPGIQKKKFLYRLNKTEYQKDFGTDAFHISFGGRLLAFFLRIVPKIGPFKALKVNLPNAQDQVVYLKSINDTVDKFDQYLAEIHAAPALLPPPDPKDADSTRQAADKVAKDANSVQAAAAKAQDPAQKAQLDQAAVHVEIASATLSAAAANADTQAPAASPAAPAISTTPVADGTPIQPPTTPVLPNLDLDTGRRPPSANMCWLTTPTSICCTIWSSPLVTPERPRLNPLIPSSSPISSASSPLPFPPPRRRARQRQQGRDAAHRQQVQTDLVALKTMPATAAAQ